MTNYEYFSGANVYIKIVPFDGAIETLIECAGISYSYQNSRQPVYGFASTQYDAMLNGRELVQGTFVVNYVEPDYVINKILGLNAGIISTLTTPKFDIEIIFGNDAKKSRVLRDCYLISMGQTVQISEQVILEEYSFLARSVENEVKYSVTPEAEPEIIWTTDNTKAFLNKNYGISAKSKGK